MQATPLKVWVHGSVWLLGLWHGAWFGHPIKEVVKKTGPGVKVSAGMGVVVPAWKIVEVLDRQELAEMRDQDAARRHADEPMPEPSGMASGPSGDDILRAAMNTPAVPRQKAKASPAKRGRKSVNGK